MKVFRRNHRMYHNGHFVYSSSGKLLGFKSEDTGVFYGHNELTVADTTMAVIERKADPMWSYAEDIIISHDVEGDIRHVMDNDIEADDVCIDGAERMSDSFYEAVCDVLLDQFWEDQAGGV